MLSDLYQTIYRNISDTTDISVEKLFEIVGYVKSKQSGSIVYQERISERFSLTEKDVSILFAELVEQSIMKMRFQQFCPTCKKILHRKFDSIMELIGSELCEYCGGELIDNDELYKYIVVRFKVI